MSTARPTKKPVLFEAANSRSVIVALSLPTSTRYPFGYYTVALFLGLERAKGFEPSKKCQNGNLVSYRWTTPANFTAVILYHGIVVLVNALLNQNGISLGSTFSNPLPSIPLSSASLRSSLLGERNSTLSTCTSRDIFVDPSFAAYWRGCNSPSI